MSACGIPSLRPSRSVKPAWNFSKSAPSSNAPLSGCTEDALPAALRSPRQCMGPSFAIPRRLWVVIGPFMGWKIGATGCPVSGSISGLAKGLRSGVTLASGLPSVHARLSKSPKT